VADIIWHFVDNQSAAYVFSKSHYHRVALIAFILVRLGGIVHIQLTGFPYESRREMFLCEV
jgi:hypothetical protein